MHQISKKIASKKYILFNLFGNIISLIANFIWLSTFNKNLSLDVVGIFISTLAISAPVFVYTNLDLRRIISLDVKYNYSDIEYLLLRFSFAIIAFCLSLIIVNYMIDSGFVFILCILFSKLLETQSELVFGSLTRANRQGKIFVSRTLKLIFTVLSVCYLQFFDNVQDMHVFILYMLSFTLPFLLHDIWVIRNFRSATFINIKKLLKTSNHMGIEALFVTLSASLPVVMLTHLALGNDVAIFGSISYITTAIQLIFSSILYSTLPQLKLNYSQANLNTKKSLELISLAIIFFGFIFSLLIANYAEILLNIIFGWTHTISSDLSLIVFLRLFGIFFIMSTTLFSTFLLLTDEYKLQKYLRIIKFIFLFLMCYLVFFLELDLVLYFSIIILILNLSEFFIFYIFLKMKNEK